MINDYIALLYQFIKRLYSRIKCAVAREADACCMEILGLSVNPLANIQAKSHQVIVNGYASIGAFTILIVKDEISGHVNGSKFIIGNDSSIGDHCNIRATGGNIEIGDKVMIASHVTMAASNHGTSRSAPMKDQLWKESPRDIIIGNDVWIAAGVTILPGARIEEGCVIAAGAVVRGNVPAFSIVGGVPARELGKRI